MQSEATKEAVKKQLETHGAQGMVDSTIEEKKKASTKKTIFALLIAFIVGAAVIIGANFFMKSSVDVFLLNGYGETMYIDVDGQRVSVEPYSYSKVTVSEGEYDFEVSGVVEKTVNAEISRGFFERFGTSFFAVNPDAMSVLYTERIPYYGEDHPDYDKVVETTPDDVEFYYGEFIKVTDNIDYTLGEESPDVVDIATDSSVAYRYQMVLYDYSIYDAAGDIEFLKGVDAALDYLIDYVEVNPSDTYMSANIPILIVDASNVSYYLEQIESLAFDSDFDINLHRLYQQSYSVVNGEEGLVDRYSDFASSDPDNMDKKFLYARILTDQSLSEATCLEVLDVSPDHAYCSYLLSSAYYLKADLEKAHEYGLKAMESDPENSMFAAYYSNILLSKGDYDKYIDMIYTSSAFDDFDTYSLAESAVFATVMTGDQKAIDSVFVEFNSLVEEYYGESTEIYTKGNIGLFTGDMSYVDAKLYTEGNFEYSDYYKYSYLMATEQYDEAITMAQELASLGIDNLYHTDYLLLAIIAKRTGDKKGEQAFTLLFLETISDYEGYYADSVRTFITDKEYSKGAFAGVGLSGQEALFLSLYLREYTTDEELKLELTSIAESLNISWDYTQTVVRNTL